MSFLNARKSKTECSSDTTKVMPSSVGLPSRRTLLKSSESPSPATPMDRCIANDCSICCCSCHHQKPSGRTVSVRFSGVGVDAFSAGMRSFSVQKSLKTTMGRKWPV